MFKILKCLTYNKFVYILWQSRQFYITLDKPKKKERKKEWNQININITIKKLYQRL